MEFDEFDQCFDELSVVCVDCDANFYKGEKVYEEVDPSLEHEVIETHNRHYLIIKR